MDDKVRALLMRDQQGTHQRRRRPSQTVVGATTPRHLGRMDELLPFQRRFLRAAFRPDVEIAALSLPRGNASRRWRLGYSRAH